MILLPVITYSIWFASEILINRLLRSNATDQQNLDKNTLRIIWITVVVSVTVSVFISNSLHISIYHRASYYYVALGAILAGCAMRFFVIRALGRQFTADVTIRKDHQLKTAGVYKYLRHPSYTSSLFSFVAFGFSLNNWLSLAIITISIVAAFMARIQVEERTLIAQFGSAYLEYKKKTYRLIPPLL
jgi:protein-S-isoprenylcysteine O-methyltransferase Ste14